MTTAELVAVQPFVTVDDYADEAAFGAKIEALFARVDGARARAPDGGFAHPALVVFPENVGTFLLVAGASERVRRCRSTDAALARVALGRPGALLATALRHRLLSPSRAVLVMLASVAWPIYHRVFREAARAHRAWVVAGSLLTPRNRLGADSERFEPLDGHFYNLSLAFDPDGRVVSETRKVNLVPTMEDEAGITPGRCEDLTPFDTDLGRVGTMICYDGFAEPHTSAAREPGFTTVGGHYDALGVEILAQPAANPWPWDERWFFAEPGETQLRREQWLSEGLCTQLRDLPHVRYAVNPQLIGELFDLRFEGTSYVFERRPDGTVETLASSRGWKLEPASEEIVLARVEAGASP